MKFKILLAAFIFATATFANEMCTELCASCENSTDASCSKIEELCACSIAKQKIENFNKKIAATVLKCDSAYCAYEIKTANDSIAVFKRVQAKILNVDTATVEQSEPVEEISSECSDMCNSCSGNFKNGTCARIETICKCTYFLELEAKKAEQHTQDSIAKIEASLLRIETANVLGKTILNTCDTAKICNVYFTVNNQNMQIVNIKKKKIEQPKPAPVVKTAPVITAKVDYTQPIDTLQTYEKKEKPLKRDEKLKTLYGGIYFAQGFYESSNKRRIFPQDMYEVDFGFLMRGYFYKYGSFQMGANILFDWTDDDNDYDQEDFLLLGLELPISLRFGLPFKCSPYLSLNTFVRVPIYKWVDTYVEGSKSGSQEGAEFVWTFGFGLEINRFVSIELQWLIESWNTSYATIPYKEMNGLSRIQLNFAW